MGRVAKPTVEGSICRDGTIEQNLITNLMRAFLLLPCGVGVYLWGWSDVGVSSLAVGCCYFLGFEHLKVSLGFGNFLPPFVKIYPPAQSHQATR